MRFIDLRRAPVVSTAPTSEPLDTIEVREHLRYADTDEDAYISRLVSAAREMVEIDAEISLMPQTLKTYLDMFPHDEIRLERPPATAVSSITYTDTSGDSQTWTSSLYDTDLVNSPGSIVPAYSQAWPVARVKPNSVVVTWTAGYATQALVPARAKEAILLLVGHWFVHRESVGMVSDEIKMAYRSLITSLSWRVQL